MTARVLLAKIETVAFCASDDVEGEGIHITSLEEKGKHFMVFDDWFYVRGDFF